MKISLRLPGLVLFSLIVLLGCTDHQLTGPTSPVRLRLKSVQVGDLLTSYGYDSQNRLTNINRSNGYSAVIAYGDPQKQYVTTDAETNNTFFVEYTNPSDRTTGLITRYPYTLDGSSFLAVKNTLFNSKIDYSKRIRTYQYTFDASKQLSDFVDSGGAPDINAYSYTYTGDNVTGETSVIAAGHAGIINSVYTYDSKLNPFYGLFDPAIDARERFSRNNATGSTSSLRGTTLFTTVYDYEYNPQGLPIKRTKKQSDLSPETTNYVYESY